MIFQNGIYLAVVTSRVTANVGHQDIHSLAIDPLYAGINSTDILPVDITINRNKRLEGR